MDRLKGNKYEQDVKQLLDELVDYINQLPQSIQEEDVRDILNWMKDYVTIKKNSFSFNDDHIPNLHRGDVVLVKFGQNIGNEFSGKHPGIVLRDCNQGIDQVMVLPITSKKPKKYNPAVKSIYIEIPKIPGLTGYKNIEDPNHPDTGKHWANILSIKNISKQRIIYPPEVVKVDGRILDIISATITSQIAFRKVKKIGLTY